ncbi:uncharacterized protein P884DRAFT_9222 [Thermothelomyces heterothallicus CBS 202.75]|uniref:uncharacterized protein n=1 Tax=Thermothelomyces heterothallicus CBS 202.75 TaxID=1149848 RepID=UPI0037424CE1
MRIDYERRTLNKHSSKPLAIRQFVSLPHSLFPPESIEFPVSCDSNCAPNVYDLVRLFFSSHTARILSCSSRGTHVDKEISLL